jgi:hypothetical protein
MVDMIGKLEECSDLSPAKNRGSKGFKKEPDHPASLSAVSFMRVHFLTRGFA